MILFDIVIDSTAEGGLIATPVAAGFVPDAQVSVAGNLSWATASATDIELFSCVEGPGGELFCDEPTGTTTSLEVSWEATTALEIGTFHAMGVDGSLAFNFRSVDGFRWAAASGVVGGVAMHDTSMFPPAIFKTNNGVVERIID